MSAFLNYCGDVIHVVMERNNKNVLRHMKDRIKSWSGGNSPLWFALQEEKETQRLTDRFGATKNSGMLDPSLIHELNYMEV